MLRELRYHEKLLPVAEFFGNDPSEKGSLAYRLNHVDFESEQTAETYIRRIIGNITTFW